MKLSVHCLFWGALLAIATVSAFQSVAAHNWFAVALDGADMVFDASFLLFAGPTE